jgi:hypothetical protein
MNIRFYGTSAIMRLHLRLVLIILNQKLHAKNFIVGHHVEKLKLNQLMSIPPNLF